MSTEEQTYRIITHKKDTDEIWALSTITEKELLVILHFMKNSSIPFGTIGIMRINETGKDYYLIEEDVNNLINGSKRWMIRY